MFVEMNDLIICVGDHEGRLVGVDRQSGRVLWRQFCPLDEVDSLQLNADTLLVVGLNGITSDATSGVLMVLDPQTGETRLPHHGG